MIKLSATRFELKEGVEGFDLPPTLKEGKALEPGVYIGEYKGTIPYVTVELGSEKAVVKFMGVDVAAADVERDEEGKFLGFDRPKHKTKDVQRALKELKDEETKRIVVGGLVYGRLVYPQEDVFVYYYGPSVGGTNVRGIFMEVFKEDKDFLSDLGFMKREVEKAVLRDDLSEEEKAKLVAQKWALMHAYMANKVEEKRERIGQILKTAIFVEGDNAFFLRNYPDKPGRWTDKMVIHTGGGRMVASGTPLSYDIRGVFSRMYKEDKSLKEALESLNRSHRAILTNILKDVETKEEAEKIFAEFLRVNAAIKRYHQNLKGMSKEDAEVVLVGELQKILGKDFKGFPEVEKEEVKSNLLLLSLQEQVLTNFQDYREKISPEEINKVLEQYEQRRKERQEKVVQEAEAQEVVAKEVQEIVAKEVYEKAEDAGVEKELLEHFSKIGMSSDADVKQELVETAKKRRRNKM